MLLPRMLARRNPPAPGTGPSTVVEVVEAIPTLFGLTPPLGHSARGEEEDKHDGTYELH